MALTTGIFRRFTDPVAMIIVVVTMLASAAFAAHGATIEVSSDGRGNLGVIRGVVRDNGGSPISDATVAIFRLGTSKLLKQVRSASDGSFLAKILPGTYTVLAVAQGFNPVTLSDVEVKNSAPVVYGFRLERAGSGNTMPETRSDRNSSKWRIRAAQMQRSIYQNTESENNVDDEIADSDIDEDDRADSSRPKQAVVETYFADSKDGAYSGVNFATLLPVVDKAEVVVAGQLTSARNAPMRVEAELKVRPNNDHQLRFNASYSRIGIVGGDDKSDSPKQLGQVSFQTLDEWKVREGFILVFGMDYSRFVGASGDFAISPRFGLQYDIDPKTRFRTAYTTQTEDRTWSQAVELENSTVIFREPVSVDDLVFEGGRAKMNRSSRLEFGIERVLDGRSNIEANVFFDGTLGRGVGIDRLAFDDLSGEGMSDFVANQQGRATGVRVVYNRRISGLFSAAAGYAFGSGQSLSSGNFTNPSDVFDNAFFQSFFGQFEADLRTGTSVKTIFRLSPAATVFAIDPFKGRLAIYDPGLSVLVTQNLPTLGLPFRAEAIVDARNVFDYQGGVNGEEGSLRLNSQRRLLRGGILVRF